VLALLLGAGIAWTVRDRAAADEGRFWTADAADVLTPLFALALLALPYLPWVADAIPAARLLAGPARLVVWSIVLGHVTWLWLARLPLRRLPEAGAGAWRPLALILPIGAGAYLLASPGASPAAVAAAACTGAIVWGWS